MRGTRSREASPSTIPGGVARFSFVDRFELVRGANARMAGAPRRVCRRTSNVAHRVVLQARPRVLRRRAFKRRRVDLGGRFRARELRQSRARDEDERSSAQPSQHASLHSETFCFCAPHKVCMQLSRACAEAFVLCGVRKKRWPLGASRRVASCGARPPFPLPRKYSSSQNKGESGLARRGRISGRRDVCDNRETFVIIASVKAAIGVKKVRVSRVIFSFPRFADTWQMRCL